MATTLTVGFIPLVDSAILIAAAERGFARAEGLDLQLVRETSWANIRDRLVLGHFDAVHMLAPLPIATTLGIGHVAVPLIAPFVLGQGGNAVTVSTGLAGAMGTPPTADPLLQGRALARVVRARCQSGLPPLTLGIVHPFSSHAYELRYWLAASGIDPEQDVRLMVLPPPLMVDALREGHFDGFCVGEPWSSLAVEEGVGRIVATKAQIWPRAPEKVVALRRRFVEERPADLAALLRSLAAAARWAAEPANREELALLLAEPRHVGVDAAILGRALSGELVLERGARPAPIDEFLLLHTHAASFPWRSHALWLYAQMVRWGEVRHEPAKARAAASVFRPDLYRTALAGQGVELPPADGRVEQGFDGRSVEPRELEAMGEGG
jgi:ABC-type nitrate/sulfonate/bicarbonate transport system substrate-binding protein